jgi:hypothetical protein
MEDYLRSYVNDTQTNWPTLLWSAEFAYNNSFHSAIQTTPFMLNYGFEPRSPLSMMVPSPAHDEAASDMDVTSSAQAFMNQMTQALSIARTCILRARDRDVYYADRHRRFLDFKSGDFVMLSTKNLRLKGEKDHPLPRRKLLPRFIGPFAITAKVGLVAYTLHLPNTFRCHPTFHVSLLRAYTPGSTAQLEVPDVMFAGYPEWEVHSILQHKKSLDGVMFYQLRWKHFESKYDSWEPESHLSGAPAILAAYKEQHNLP